MFCPNKRMLLLMIPVIFSAAPHPDARPAPAPVLVIHGGAGNISPSVLGPEGEKAFARSLQAALAAGYAVLQKGGPALDAVQASVRLLEDDPLFNAGKGAVTTSRGTVELDAAIMEGKDLRAGAVAGLSHIKNPVLAARAVMEKSGHVMMAGWGAEQFAASQGLQLVDSSYFLTSQAKTVPPNSLVQKIAPYLHRYGTVGAVALDASGNLAAATSTGGLQNKRPGRIGDSPIIGAGTYASNRACAVSCTGTGEYFIRLSVAKSVCDLMEWGHLSLAKAAEKMIFEKVPQLGGDGGLIAVDRNGNIAMPFNTTGMFRAYIKAGGKPVVEMYGQK